MPGWLRGWRTASAPAFVFSAQGGQWPGMGRELFARERTFRRAILRCDDVVRRLAGWSLAAELAAEPGAGSSLHRADRVQPALTALQVALAELLAARGVRPAAVAGLSMGEAAAAHLAGALSLQDALRVVCTQAALTARAVPEGRMVVVSLDGSAARALARGEERVSVAVELAPCVTVLAGEAAAVERVAAAAREAGAQVGGVNVGFAFHTPEVAALENEFRSALAPLRPRDARVPLYSSAAGGRVAGRELDAAHWWRIMSAPARFAPMVDALLADGHAAMVEVGPHPTLVEPIRQTARACGREAAVTGLMTRDGGEARRFHDAVAALRG